MIKPRIHCVVFVPNQETILCANPATQLTPYQMFNEIHPSFAIVQAWDMGEFFATRFPKRFSCFDSDLFECFETIRDKTWIDDRNSLHTIARQLLDGFVGIGLQPLLGPEA